MGRTFLDDFDAEKKKRRRNREVVHIAEDTSRGDSQEELEDNWDSDVEQQETLSQNHSLDIDESTNSVECLSKLATNVRNASDKELQLVLTACIGRFSQKDLDRLLTTYDDPCFFNSGCSNSNKNEGSSSLKPFIIRNIGFNLTSAKRNESLISLPSGCQFYMSQILSNYEASNFTSSEYKNHGKSIIRRVFSVVCKKDLFFPAYSASENSHAYCSLGSTFFTKVTNFLINGFNQEHSDEVEIYTIRMCRDAVGNLIDRVRRQFVVLHPETNAEQLAIELKSLLAKHGNVPNTIEFYPEHDEYDLASTSSGNY
ncbi:hypothetical protein L5515_014971 [Caenorhabditis briggsae]|uniref:Uncharacterized protein n=1 Tax=Caenorhabditis briggsae TaxID=6238 RepID=A0AAE9EER3_CAEBR|nr:hypothetical protein L5515_014971 [Caenorhabditis briggsae]